MTNCTEHCWHTTAVVNLLSVMGEDKGSEFTSTCCYCGVKEVKTYGPSSKIPEKIHGCFANSFSHGSKYV